MTHADGYFAIGKTHTVCEDYVRCGTLPNGRSYAIVSDGCSSSDDTDIGARMLVLAAEQYMHINDPIETSIGFRNIADMARSVVHSMRLDPTCLDATLIIALETETQIAVYKMGDGVVAARFRNGSMTYSSTEFSNGAPYYPNYMCDNLRHEGYRAMSGNDVTITEGVVSGDVAKRTMTMLDYGLIQTIPLVFPKTDVDLVVMMTDGAVSFRKGLEPVPVGEIVKQILDVKVPTGEFMIRRAKRFLGNYCTTQGWHHDDDFGVGAIFVDGVAP